MSMELVAKRYAVALFKIAKEQQLLETFEEELRSIKQVFETSDLALFLQQPNISSEKKKALLSQAFTSVSQQILNTLYILIDNHREEIVADMADAFFALANEERNVADALVYTIRPLTEAEKVGVAESFAKMSGKDAIRIQNIVDDSLLGGIKVRIGNRIYDGSLKGKLTRIERTLLNNR